MYKRTEGYFQGYQDIRLYYQKWAAQKPKGILVITPGHGEHSECYWRVAGALAGEGWTILAWDWRGHGRSEGVRGYAEHFNDYCLDFELFLNQIFTDENYAKYPIALLAHSMGGLIQLKTILSNPRFKFAGQVLSAPLLGLSMAVPPYKEAAAQFLGNVLPKMTLSNGINDEDLSRDPEVIREYKTDVLRHDKISAGVYFGSLEAMKLVLERAQKIEIPTLLQIAERDPVVSVAKAKEFFKTIGSKNKKLCLYPNRKHEIYNDLGREEVYSDLKEFLKGIV